MNIMTKIETIKAAVTPTDAARQYGLAVGNHGMACCPYHDDRHPSMKLYGDHFYCFACGTHGDVIDLTAKLLGLNFTEAVHRLAVDFGIDPDKPPTAMPVRPYLAQFRKDETLCISVLTEYEQLLRRWKTEYAPKTPDDKIDDRFVEACQMLDQIEYMADFLCAAELEERVKAVDELIQNGLIEKLRFKLEEVSGNGRAA